MKSYIYIDNAEFYAFHGVFEQETIVGNTFLVSINIEADIVRATESDHLEDTISYADIYKIIRDEMSVPSKLIEHVGGRIIRALRREFPAIQSVDLSICKKNPPISGQMSGAGIRLISEF